MKHLHKPLACFLLLVWSALAIAQPIRNDDLRNSPAVIKAFRDVVAKPSESVVRVQCAGKDVALGTIVGADGWILTKASMLDGPVVCKFKDGKSYGAKLVGVQKDYDLAMLKVEAKDLVPVFWRDSREAKVGKWVASVGLDKEPIAIGIISVGTRSFKPGDQPVLPGANAGYLGVGLANADDGARVTTVEPRSPADRAGLRINDVVYEAAGRRILDVESFINTIQRHKPKDIVLLKLRRGDEEREVTAKLDPLPKIRMGNPQERMGSILSNRRGGFPTILQHDTVLKPTDCGGPLVDLDGMTVGINLSRAGRTESYAAPSEDVIPLLAALKSGELAPTTDISKVEPLANSPKTSDVILRTLARLRDSDSLRDDRYVRSELVRLGNGGAYTIELASRDFNVHLIVTDGKGNKLAESQATDDDKIAKVSLKTTFDGDYRIVITTVDPGVTGAYSLTVRQTTAPKDPPMEKKKKRFTE